MQILFWLVSVLSVGLCILESLALFQVNYYEYSTGKQDNAKNDFEFIYSRFSVFFLQLFYGVLLIVAVFMIRSFLVSNGFGHVVNY